jgi:hypothetical protein
MFVRDRLPTDLIGGRRNATLPLMCRRSAPQLCDQVISKSRADKGPQRPHLACAVARLECASGMQAI